MRLVSVDRRDQVGILKNLDQQRGKDRAAAVSRPEIVESVRHLSPHAPPIDPFGCEDLHDVRVGMVQEGDDNMFGGDFVMAS